MVKILRWFTAINHHLFPIAIQLKSILLEQFCYKRSQGIAVTVLSSFFNVKKQRPKKIKKSTTNAV